MRPWPDSGDDDDSGNERGDTDEVFSGRRDGAIRGRGQDELSSSRYMRTSTGGASFGRFGGHPSSSSNSRCLTTYVNSKKCCSVSADSRGVIGATDGRFAINPKLFNLFSSSQPRFMPGNYDVITANSICCVHI